jgi:hypothetical protein
LFSQKLIIGPHPKGDEYYPQPQIINLFKIHFNVFPFRPKSSKWSLPFRYSDPTHPIFLDLIILIMFGEEHFVGFEVLTAVVINIIFSGM